MIKKITLVALMLSSINAFTQENIKTYSGDMKIPKDILGKNSLYGRQSVCTYSYYELKDSQRVKHGKFELIYYYNFFKYTVVGQYLDGKKNGVWVSKEYDRKNQEKDKFTITYKDDLLNGQFSGVLYEYSEKPDIKCSGSFKDGVYIGDIIVETPNSNGVMKGSFNESGWAHGKWSIERKKGIPIKQEREYYEGLLLKAVEIDLSTGEKTILFEFPENSISDIKNSLNVIDSTLIISGVHYKRVQDKCSLNHFDSRLFPNTSGGKSVINIFNDIYSPTIKNFIPLVNGFSCIEKDYNWYEAEREEKKKI